MSDRLRVCADSLSAARARRRLARAISKTLEPLEPRQLMAAQPVITEFMAKNGVTLTDGFGQNSDWIEITNQGDASIDMAGWHLTDSTNLSKWTFPTFTLAPGQIRVVFADSLNTTDPAGNLHTNFSLSDAGEKLALTRPDLSIASRYEADGSDYPAQLPDVSYGIGTIYNNTTLVGPKAPAKAFVPVNGTLDANQWTALGYNDASWISGTTGVGFDTGGYEDTTLPPAIVGDWSADSLISSVGNGGVVNSWTDSIHGSTAYKAGSPTLVTNAINGHAVVHFNPADGNDLLRVPAASNPMAGADDFTIVVVFRATAGIGSSGGQWTANAGLVDGSVNGVTNDWGMSLSSTSGGRVIAGVGAPDTTIFTAGNQVNGAAHVAIFTRSDTKISLYIDGGDPVSVSSNDAARGLSDMVFGALQTNANYFTGDLAEVRIYDGAMTTNLAYSAATTLGTRYSIPLTAPSSPLGATLTGDWIADSLNGAADNSTVTAWGSSVGTHNATASGAPKLRKSQLNGHSVVRFNPGDGNDNLRVAASANPLSNTGDFSVAVVFRTGTNGAGDGSQWYNNTGIVDGEVGGVTDDWGLALDGSGQIAGGIGNPDASLYSSGGNANGVGHVVVYSKIGDLFRITIDGGQAYEASAGTANRISEDLVFGSIQTNINYYTGDIAEVQTYSGGLDEDAAHALSGTLATKYGIALAPDRYDPLIGIPLQSQMYNTATTALIRIPFTVADPSAFDKLTLSMEYDDGFVAYLNGTEIARRNASGSITYTSVADGARLDTDALTPELIDVTAFKSLLIGGGATNVLSIRALNSSLADPDLLIIPQLIGSKATVGEAYMSKPTPGAPNGEGYAGFVPSLTVTKAHGIYTSAFDTTVSTTVPGVTLVYTLDGSDPSLTNGIVVTPANANALNSFTLNISKSTTLRVIGFKNTFLPSAISTQTYVFPASVLTQTNVQPAGAYWDTEVDPDVVNASQTYTVTQALSAIPTVSLVLPDEDMFGSTGIYKNPSQSGAQWERQTSVEYFDPNDPSLQFQVDAGIRVEGGSVRDTGRPKKAFRLYFRSQYGASKLEEPLFGTSDPEQSFDHLVLRAGNNNTWANEPGTNGDYIRDQFSESLQGAVNGYTAAGKWVQLYINGLYWGVYNLQEDVDSTWAAANFGGSKDDYDLLEPDHNGGMEVNSGTADAYNNLFSTVDTAIASGGTVDNNEYAAISQLVDVDKLAGYMLSTLYRGDQDSPVLIGSATDPRNFYAFRNAATNGKFYFQTWDGELAMNDVNLDRTEVMGNLNPSRLFNQLRTNGEFQQLVTDKIFKLFNNGGPLQVSGSVNKPVDLYNTLVNKLNIAIVGESARWGDAKRSTPYMRDTDWVTAINWMRNTFMAQRSAVVLGQLQADFPAATGLPAIFKINGQTSRGGNITAGSLLTLVDGNTTTTGDSIYYTTDGTDPRLAGGGISSSAHLYTGAVAINANTTVIVRTLKGTTWTAQDSVNFVVTSNGLRITELAYNPTVPAGGTYSAGDYEYIELQNTGSAPLDISGSAFTAGVTYTFPANTILQAGEYIVVAKTVAAFQQRYGTSIRVSGAYTGSLANEGETVTLVDALAATIQTFAYSPTWYPVTNAGGFSLVIRNALADKSVWATAAGWRPSQQIGGSPGVVDVDLPPSVAITAIAPSPRNTTLDTVSIVFSEPVTGFDLADLSLTRTGSTANLLTSSTTLTTSDGGRTWTLGNLTGLETLDGTYTLTLTSPTIVDLTGNALPAGTSASFAIDRVAPTFSSGSLLLDFGKPQLRFNFSESIIDAGVTPVLTITRNSDGTPVAVGTRVISGNTVTYDLPTTLIDGDFTATLTTPGVKDAAGNVDTASATQSFFFLGGDVNHDRKVDFSDLVILAQNYGQTGRTFSQGNLNFSADGAVDFNDLVLLAQHYNQSLPVQMVAATAKPTATKAKSVTKDVLPA